MNPRVAFKIARGWYEIYERDGTYVCCVATLREVRGYGAELTTVGAAVNREVSE